MPIINWTLKQNLDDDFVIQSDWVNPYYAKKDSNLSQKISYAISNFPCDILFIHRDSEKKSESVVQARKHEIETAWSNSIKKSEKYVPVVPVRMTEAWLLINESAIRAASGNPNGKVQFLLPEISRMESLSNPKEKLEKLIYTASELRGRNLKKFNVNKAKHLVSEYIDDFLLLRRLNAFQLFETDLKSALKILLI